MASMADLDDALEADKTIDPNDIFELTEKLGEGSYGSVFKGIHKVSTEPVAVKMVPVDGDFDDIAKEIRILKKCDSVYVVKYYGSYTHGDNLWIVIECKNLLLKNLCWLALVVFWLCFGCDLVVIWL